MVVILTGMANLNRMWRLAKQIDGEPTDADIEWHEQIARAPAEGDVLVQTTHVIVDALAWSLAPVAEGATMPGGALGVVIESRDPSVAVGAKVSGLLGWQTHATVPAGQVVVHDSTLSDEDYLGAVSYLGATAYLGVREIARPMSGETFVVTSASLVGSLAGQIAKQEGARVVGIAMTPAQCAWLTELGFDAAIDRRAEDLAPALARACPDGIHACIDGFGGSVLDACLAQLARGARVALYGTRPGPAPTHFSVIPARRTSVRGYSFLDFTLQLEETLAALTSAVKAGTLRYKLDLIDGLEHAPAAMRRVKSESDCVVLKIPS